MSASDMVIAYIDNVRNKEVIKMSKDFKEHMDEFYKHYEEKFGVPYNPDKKMTEEEKEETMAEAYERVFNYEPTDEEVRAKYPDEFNEWFDKFLED